MATWPVSLPKIQTAKGYIGRDNWLTLVTPFDAGYEHTRPQFTRNRREWSGGWMGLTVAQFLAFTSFVNEVKGGADSWKWTDYNIATAATTYTVRFIEESINWRRHDFELFDVSFAVREI